MRDHSNLSPKEQIERESFKRRFYEELKKQPEISDEEFMAEFEASDEEYKRGFVLPDIGKEDEK